MNGKHPWNKRVSVMRTLTGCFLRKLALSETSNTWHRMVESMLIIIGIVDTDNLFRECPAILRIDKRVLLGSS